MSNQNLQQLSTKELLEKIKYFEGFSPRGMNYQNDLNRHEAELERRFLAWETAEV